MYIYWVLCQVGRSKTIVLGPMYVYWSLFEMVSSKSIVLSSYVYIGPYVRLEGIRK